MYEYSFSKFLILLLSLACSSCYVTNYQTILKKKDGSNIVLYQKDDQKVFLSGYMKEINHVFGQKVLIQDTSNYVKLQLQVNKFETLVINKFAISISYENQGSFIEIDSGRIYYDPELITFNTYININDSILNFSLEPMDIYSVNTIFIVESDPTKKLLNPSKFLIETHFDFVLDSKEYSINKTDTLYKKVIKRQHLTTH